MLFGILFRISRERRGLVGMNGSLCLVQMQLVMLYLQLSHVLIAQLVGIITGSFFPFLRGPLRYFRNLYIPFSGLTLHLGKPKMNYSPSYPRRLQCSNKFGGNNSGCLFRLCCPERSRAPRFYRGSSRQHNCAQPLLARCFSSR
jgi:hypothetical protein